MPLTLFMDTQLYRMTTNSLKTMVSIFPAVVLWANILSCSSCHIMNILFHILLNDTFSVLLGSLLGSVFKTTPNYSVNVPCWEWMRGMPSREDTYVSKATFGKKEQCPGQYIYHERINNA